MRVLVIGANGFVGRGVSEVLQQEHEVIASARATGEDGSVQVDLSDPSSIRTALETVKPEAIVDCAGVVENSEKAAANPQFTKNLLESVVASGLPIRRVVVMGSAGEYGEVETLPVDEDTPRRATSPYGVSKMQETDIALGYREQGLPVVVARLFNPIGQGMHERMIIPRVMSQVEAVRAGTADKIEVNRLDALRDYVNLEDIGTAIGALLGDKEPQHGVYNVGSGVATSNQHLIELILAASDLPQTPKLTETSSTPEPQFAAQADISRLTDEFGWRPAHSIEETVRELVHATKR